MSFFKRLPVTTSLLATLLALPLLLVQSAMAADGEKFIRLHPAQPVSTTDKVEVIEVFNYACIHCAHFQPLVDAYLKKMDPKKVEFLYLPAPFNPIFTLTTRGYYVAEQLGVQKTTHHGVFNAIFEKRMPLRTIDDLANIYQSLGVKREDFMSTAATYLIEGKLTQANKLIRDYQISATPTIIVAGKYLITDESAGGWDKAFAVVDELVEKEYAALKRGTQKTIPKQDLPAAAKQ
jgi:protein dithiol oxidoreductase (disulfide-forming)